MFSPPLCLFFSHLQAGRAVVGGPELLDLSEANAVVVPERVTLKFSVKVSGLSVQLFIYKCKYFATLNMI